jgi:anaerobic selenocysteine-containing dehydrogenase
MLLQPIPDVDRTHYFLMLGANPLASNGSLWTVPDVRRRLKDLQARGGKLVVIDPRRTETAEMASEHHFIKPGTDATFLLAMIHVLFRDGLVDPGAMKSYTDGVDEVGAAVTELTPQWAEERTGIAAADIERIAHDMAAAEAGICYGRMGVSTQAYGALCQWAIQVINVVTGILISLVAAFLRRRQWIRWPIPVQAVSLGSRVESAVYLSLTTSCLQRRWPMKFALPERGRSS